MNGFFEAIEETLHFLSSQETLKDLVFCEEYPASWKASPLRRVTVAVGLEQADSATDALGRYLGGQAGQAVTGAPWALRMRLQIHAPNQLGGGACRDAFARIWEALYFDAPFAIAAAGCGSISARRDTGSLELNAWIERKLYIAREEAISDE